MKETKEDLKRFIEDYYNEERYVTLALTADSPSLWSDLYLSISSYLDGCGLVEEDEEYSQIQDILLNYCYSTMEEYANLNTERLLNEDEGLI